MKPDGYLLLYVVVLLTVVLAILSMSGRAMQESYDVNQCELMAKDYQREYGGSLVLIQPLKDNGAYDLGRYSGHWINHVGGQYIDYGTNTAFQSNDDVLGWYGRKAVLFDLGEKRPPFSIRWNYG